MQRGSRGRIIVPKYYPEPVIRFPSPSRFQITNKCKCIPVTETERDRNISDWILDEDHRYYLGDPASWAKYPDKIQLLCDLPSEPAIKPNGFGSPVDVENQAPNLQTAMKTSGFGFSTIQNSAAREPLAPRREQQVAAQLPTVREFMSSDRKLALEQLKLRNQMPIASSSSVPGPAPEPVSHDSVNESIDDEEYDSNNSNETIDFIPEGEVLRYAAYVMVLYPVIPEGFDNNDPFLEVY